MVSEWAAIGGREASQAGDPAFIAPLAGMLGLQMHSLQAHKVSGAAAAAAAAVVSQTIQIYRYTDIVGSFQAYRFLLLARNKTRGP